jgi:hypothetical protein
MISKAIRAVSRVRKVYGCCDPELDREIVLAVLDVLAERGDVMARDG